VKITKFNINLEILMNLSSNCDAGYANLNITVSLRAESKQCLNIGCFSLRNAVCTCGAEIK